MDLLKNTPSSHSTLSDTHPDGKIRSMPSHNTPLPESNSHNQNQNIPNTLNGLEFSSLIPVVQQIVEQNQNIVSQMKSATSELKNQTLELVAPVVYNSKDASEKLKELVILNYIDTVESFRETIVQLRHFIISVKDAHSNSLFTSSFNDLYPYSQNIFHRKLWETIQHCFSPNSNLDDMTPLSTTNPYFCQMHKLLHQLKSSLNENFDITQDVETLLKVIYSLMVRCSDDDYFIQSFNILSPLEYHFTLANSFFSKKLYPGAISHSQECLKILDSIFLLKEIETKTADPFGGFPVSLNIHDPWNNLKTLKSLGKMEQCWKIIIQSYLFTGCHSKTIISGLEKFQNCYALFSDFSKDVNISTFEFISLRDLTLKIANCELFRAEIYSQLNFYIKAAEILSGALESLRQSLSNNGVDPSSKLPRQKGQADKGKSLFYSSIFKFKLSSALFNILEDGDISDVMPQVRIIIGPSNDDIHVIDFIQSNLIEAIDLFLSEPSLRCCKYLADAYLLLFQILCSTHVSTHIPRDISSKLGNVYKILSESIILEVHGDKVMETLETNALGTGAVNEPNTESSLKMYQKSYETLILCIDVEIEIQRDILVRQFHLDVKIGTCYLFQQKFKAALDQFLKAAGFVHKCRQQRTLESIMQNGRIHPSVLIRLRESISRSQKLVELLNLKSGNLI